MEIKQLTFTQAAKMLGIRRIEFERYFIDAGVFKVIPMGRKKMVLVRDIYEWQEENKQISRSAA